MTVNTMQLPSQEEWEAWLEHPATQALRAAFKAQQDDRKDMWMSGLFTDQSQYGTAILNAKAIGFCEAAQIIIDLDYQQVIQEIEDGRNEEHERPETFGPGSTG